MEAEYGIRHYVVALLFILIVLGSWILVIGHQFDLGALNLGKNESLGELMIGAYLVTARNGRRYWGQTFDGLVEDLIEQFAELLKGVINWARASAPDSGTALLGVAAILLARAIPSSDFGESDFGLIRLSIGFALLGLALRRLGNP